MSTRLPSCVAVVGLGYVGLPLAAAFARYVRTIGFDVDQHRVEELRQGRDRNGDIPSESLKVPRLTLTSEPRTLGQADFFVIAVPTPVGKGNHPDLQYVLAASQLVGRALRERAAENPSATPPIVVYESTVYPGCTEEDCVPVLEQESGLIAGRDFGVGYSPERINPGDHEHTLERVVKVVAGQDQESTEVIAHTYNLVVEAGVYKAPDIRTAEAAKVIENTQRDLNIALMNELAMLFHRLGLDTREVLAAARTKWNFLPFEPGLVGGHCIPVDPYYLTYRAEQAGYHPEVILAGRRINDRMGEYIAQQLIRLLVQIGSPVQGATVLVLGFTFKENVPDARNTRVRDLVRELEEHGVSVSVHDPFLSDEQLRGFGAIPTREPFILRRQYNAVILAVAHSDFRVRNTDDFARLLRKNAGVIVDVKGVLPRTGWPSGVLYWAL